jgi:site-specific DNA recombinase
MNVALYLRQSMDKLADELVVTRQEAECRALCESRGWRVVAVYTDNDTSASAKSRPDYERMPADYGTGKFQAVVAWDLDRLYRYPKQLEHLIDVAEKDGLTLATVGGDADLATDNGRLFARIKAAVARGEIERKGARQKAAARRRAVSGGRSWSSRPLGITEDGTGLVEQEAEALRWAYQEVVRGGTFASIAREFNARGLRTTRDNEWTPTSLRPVLLNVRNIGRREYKGQDVGEASWPAIVDPGTFYSAVAVLRDAPRGKGGSPRRNLLTGLVKCGRCGKGMVAAQAGAGATKRKIYRCPTGHLSTNADPLEVIVRKRALEVYAASDSRVLEPRRAPVDTDALVADERALTERLDGLADAYATGAVTLQQLTRATAAIEAQIEEVRAKLAEAPQDLQFAGQTLGELREMLSNDATARGALERFELVVHPVARGAKRAEDTVDVKLATT